MPVLLPGNDDSPPSDLKQERVAQLHGAANHHAPPQEADSPRLLQSLSEQRIVLEIRKLDRGPALLPQRGAAGEITWSQPDDQRISFADYIRICLTCLTGQNWENRIHQYAEGIRMPRYQAAVSEKDAKIAWDALLIPFNIQRSAYRRHYRAKNAPDIFFGVKPRAPRRSVDDPAPSNSEKVRGVRLQPERPLKCETAPERHAGMAKGRSYPEAQASDHDMLTWLPDTAPQQHWLPAYPPTATREAFQAESFGPSSLVVQPPPQGARPNGSAHHTNLPIPEASPPRMAPYEHASTHFDAAFGAKVDGSRWQAGGWSQREVSPPNCAVASQQGVIRREPPPAEQCFGMFRENGGKAWMSQPPPVPSCVNTWSACEVTPFGQLAVE
jgi:hypothetical protein